MMEPERVVCVGWEEVVWWERVVLVGAGETARRERRERGGRAAGGLVGDEVGG